MTNTRELSYNTFQMGDDGEEVALQNRFAESLRQVEGGRRRQCEYISGAASRTAAHKGRTGAPVTVHG